MITKPLLCEVTLFSYTTVLNKLWLHIWINIYVSCQMLKSRLWKTRSQLLRTSFFKSIQRKEPWRTKFFWKSLWLQHFLVIFFSFVCFEDHYGMKDVKDRNDFPFFNLIFCYLNRTIEFLDKINLCVFFFVRNTILKRPCFFHIFAAK